MIPETKKDITTPALLLDLDKLEYNIGKMAFFFSETSANVRPMFKTHKLVPIALHQLEAGADGITCAKLSEAEALVEGGVMDILIANQVVGEDKLTRLMALQKKADVKVAVDDPVHISALSAAATAAGVLQGVLIEVNVGLPRCGVAPEKAVTLAELVDKSPGLLLRGIMGYEGHLVLLDDEDRRVPETKKSMTLLVSAAKSIRDCGLTCDIVSAGGTGTYNVTGAFPGITEVQAGSYVMMDTKYDKLGLGFEKAVTILSTVQSTALDGWAIIDAGVKVMTNDFGLPDLIGVADTKLVLLSEEHGHLYADGKKPDLSVGDKVELYPSHICTTVNLHDRIYALRNDRVEEIWPITGRGCSQ
jgi:D-serine deaminase-like pyridoxal phosphate-dependent protein